MCDNKKLRKTHSHTLVITVKLKRTVVGKKGNYIKLLLLFFIYET